MIVKYIEQENCNEVYVSNEVGTCTDLLMKIKKIIKQSTKPEKKTKNKEKTV